MAVPFRQIALVLAAAALTAAAYFIVVAAPPGPRSLRAFDPDRTAELEVDMWQASYLKQNWRLFRGLVLLTHEQSR